MDLSLPVVSCHERVPAVETTTVTMASPNKNPFLADLIVYTRGIAHTGEKQVLFQRLKGGFTCARQVEVTLAIGALPSDRMNVACQWHPLVLPKAH